MIQKINGLKSLGLAPRITQRNEKTNNKSYLYSNSYDTFERSTSPSFKGVEKTEVLVERVTKYLENASGKVKTYKDEVLPQNQYLRYGVAIGSLGLSELFAYARAVYKVDKDKRDYCSNFTSVGQSESYELEELIKSSDEESERIRNLLINEFNSFIEMDNIRQEQIIPKLIAPLAYKTELPNSLMFVSKNQEVTDELIHWTKLNADARIVTIGPNDGILANMKKAKEHYEKNGEHTLLQVKNFEYCINSTYSSEENIAGIKSLLGNCARLYHTTVIFSAKKPEDLDKIAIGPHRVTQIDASSVEKSIGQIWVDIARRQQEEGVELNDYEKLRNMIYLSGFNKLGINISPNATKADIAETIQQMDKALLDSVQGYYKVDRAELEKYGELKTTKGFIYVKDDDGQIKKVPGFKHTISTPKSDSVYPLQKELDSIISLDESLGLMENIILKQRPRSRNMKFNDAPYEWNTLTYEAIYDYHIRAFKYWHNDISKGYLDTLPFANYIFNLTKNDIKLTGIKALDRYFTDIDTSPFSMKSRVEYSFAMENDGAPLGTLIKHYPPHDWDFKSDLLHSFGDKGVDFMHPMSKTYPNTSCCYWDDNVKAKSLADWKGEDVSTENPSKERLKEINNLRNSVIFSENELSPVELERRFTIERLKDHERNLEQPLDALNDLLFVRGLYDKYKVNSNSSNEEICSALRAARDSVLELTKSDLQNLKEKNDFSYDKSYHQGQKKEAFGLPALMVIANIHLNDGRYGHGLITSTSGYSSTYYSIDDVKINDIARRMEHYEEIKACTGALDGILRRPAWYYKVSGY